MIQLHVIGDGRHDYDQLVTLSIILKTSFNIKLKFEYRNKNDKVVRVYDCLPLPHDDFDLLKNTTLGDFE